MFLSTINILSVVQCMINVRFFVSCYDWLLVLNFPRFYTLDRTWKDRETLKNDEEKLLQTLPKVMAEETELDATAPDSSVSKGSTGSGKLQSLTGDLSDGGS